MLSDPSQKERLPRGRHGLPRAAVHASQQRRILESVVDVVADAGYAGASVSRIVARAGVSREAFYGHFSSKEECWAAAMDAIVGAHTDAVMAALDAPGTPLDRCRAALDAYLRQLTQRPAAARCLFLERPPQQFGASPREAAVRDGMAAALQSTLQLRSAFPAVAFVAMVGGLIRDRTAAGGGADLADLLDPAMELLAVISEGYSR